jgi:hypothetical protein
VSLLLPQFVNEINQFDMNMNNYINDLDEDEKFIDIIIDIRLFNNDDIMLTYYYEDAYNQVIDSFSQELTMDMLTYFLIRLLYYYPHIDMRDDHNWSYLHVYKTNNKILTARNQFIKQHDIDNKILSLSK